MSQLVALLALHACTGSDPTPSPDAEADPSNTPPQEEPAEAGEETVAADGTLPPGTELPDPSTLPDVLLVTLDTTRADRIGSYGYDKARTDSLDALAERGRRYARAYAPLPLTIPSHATMFTGLYPPEHGVRANSDQVLGEEFVTLAERLRAVGYRTGASVAAFVTTRRFGFSQGFDAYFDNVEIDNDHWHSERPADQVIDDILGWDALQEDDAPRFAWVHLYDAHHPYRPRKGYLDKNDPRPYDAELAWVDDQVQRLIDGFATRDTLIVVVGDHGEALGQHHERTHGMQVYDNTQHVPFIMAGPGVEAGQVVEQPVSVADVSPIVLDQLGLPPLVGASGLAERDEDSPPVYMEAYEMAFRFSLAPPVAVVSGPLKLISLPRPELYDLTQDPEEVNDLAAERPDDVQRLADALAAFQFGPPEMEVTAGAAGADLQSQLEALGYVGGSQEVDFESDLDDPKDHVELLQKVQRIDLLAREKAPEKMIALLEELVQTYPHVVEFHARLAKVHRRNGDPLAAEDAVEAGLAVSPGNVRLELERAGILVTQRRFAEASAAFQATADAAQSMAPRVRVMAVLSLAQSGAVRQAETLGEAYLDEHPDDYNLAGFLGAMYTRRGEYMKGLPYLQRGILADVPEVDVAYFMAAVAAGNGDRAGSIELLRTELKNHPANLKALSSLGRLLLADRQPKEVLDLTAQTLQRDEYADAHFLRAQALFNLGRLEDARKALDRGMAIDDPPAAELVMLEANLLHQEGKPDAAQKAYERAKTLRKAEVEQRGQLPQMAPAQEAP